MIRYKKIYIKLLNFYFILLSSLLSLLQVDAFLWAATSTYVRLCDTFNSQECTSILQLKIHNIYIVQKLGF